MGEKLELPRCLHTISGACAFSAKVFDPVPLLDVPRDGVEPSRAFKLTAF